jgi:hypothetical protein
MEVWTRDRRLPRALLQGKSSIESVTKRIIARGAALFLAFASIRLGRNSRLARGHVSELLFGSVQDRRVIYGMLHICLGI